MHSKGGQVMSLAHIAARAYPSFLSMKQLGVLQLLLDGMLVHGWREAP